VILYNEVNIHAIYRQQYSTYTVKLAMSQNSVTFLFLLSVFVYIDTRILLRKHPETRIFGWKNIFKS